MITVVVVTVSLVVVVVFCVIALNLRNKTDPMISEDEPTQNSGLSTQIASKFSEVLCENKHDYFLRTRVFVLSSKCKLLFSSVVQISCQNCEFLSFLF